MKTILLAEYGYFLLSNEYTQNREKERIWETFCIESEKNEFKVLSLSLQLIFIVI